MEDFLEGDKEIEQFNEERKDEDENIDKQKPV